VFEKLNDWKEMKKIQGRFERDSIIEGRLKDDWCDREKDQ
jgi:hypothetical protein